jgi:hypothetical protein
MDGSAGRSEAGAGASRTGVTLGHRRRAMARKPDSSAAEEVMRYNHNIYAGAKTARFIVLFDLQWKIIECTRLEPPVDLAKSMAATLQRLTEEGWQPETTQRFGFVFLNRSCVRRLLILTERDPRDSSAQTFSPFK